jgi:hypothetical protein
MAAEKVEKSRGIRVLSDSEKFGAGGRGPKRMCHYSANLWRASQIILRLFDEKQETGGFSAEIGKSPRGRMGELPVFCRQRFEESGQCLCNFFGA